MGGELKGILSADELKTMVQGFGDGMSGSVEDEKTLLMKYGPALNEMLQSRAMKAVNEEKKKGEEYITKYLLSNPKAVKTSSGLIYNEILAGIGEQVRGKWVAAEHFTSYHETHGFKTINFQ